MNKSNKLVFFGNERLATATSTTAPTLRALIAAGYQIEAVITGHSDSVSRQKRNLEIGLVAHSFNIPVILPGKTIDLASKLKHHQTEAAVLVAYGQLIPQKVIDLFPKGIINIHPSLLPELRGPTPIETAILNGLDKTGVSLMKITAAMDAGPVYTQKEMKLKDHETKFELAERLGNVGAQLLVEHLPNVLGETLSPTAQDKSTATYSSLLTKEDGTVNWNKPAARIEREVRAYLGWPKSSASIFGHNIIITKARVAKNKEDGDLVMQCQPGWLEVQQLTAPSGRTITGAEFLRGYIPKQGASMEKDR